MPKLRPSPKADQSALAAAAPVEPKWLVPFFWRAFSDKYRALLWHAPSRGATLRDAAFRLGLWGANQLGWGLDNILAPGWRHTPLGTVVFIVGHQRSGTTLLHRALAASHPDLTATPFAAMLLPAVTWRRLARQLYSELGPLSRRLRAVLHARQAARFGRLDSIHRLRLQEAEEDEFILWSIFASGMCANDGPHAMSRPELDWLRDFDLWSSRRQRAALGYYAACLRKTLHHTGAQAPVAKNPAFSGKMPKLRRAFPGAKFIYLVRDPLKAIPSRLSLIQAIWQLRFGNHQVLQPHHVETIYRDSVRTYEAAEAGLAALPESARLVLPYPELVADPAAALARVHRHFDLPEPERLPVNARHDASRHRYEARDFGLDPQRIKRDLAWVYERYPGLPEGHAPSPAAEAAAAAQTPAQ